MAASGATIFCESVNISPGTLQFPPCRGKLNKILCRPAEPEREIVCGVRGDRPKGNAAQSVSPSPYG